jgi:hypothetical protein
MRTGALSVRQRIASAESRNRRARFDIVSQMTHQNSLEHIACCKGIVRV